MIYLDYRKEGIPLSDFEIEKFLEETIIWTINKGEDLVIKVSTCNVVDMVHTYIAEQKLNVEDFKFLFKGKEVYVDKYGHTPGSPEGYCDFTANVAERRIKAGILRRKKEKENKG